MRQITVCLILLFVLSCKKHNTTETALQHKWQITSLNGEAFRYVGKPTDFWDFRTNDTLIQSTSGTSDTVSYTLDNNGTILNIKSFAYSLKLNITTLTNTQLIVAGTGQGGYVGAIGNVLDSLHR
jgi:hypothetical protein